MRWINLCDLWWLCGSLFLSSNREVDKVLSGLEILSKVFDQQSAFMVSKMIQQVCFLFCVCPLSYNGGSAVKAFMFSRVAQGQLRQILVTQQSYTVRWSWNNVSPGNSSTLQFFFLHSLCLSGPICTVLSVAECCSLSHITIVSFESGRMSRLYVLFWNRGKVELINSSSLYNGWLATLHFSDGDWLVT